MCLITERYAPQISGVLSCFDRIVIQGTLPGLCYADGMTGYLHSHEIRIFDYPRFAEPFRDELRENAEKLAAENDIEIEFVRNHEIRKEELIQQILKKRGDRPGLVHILSAMESCPTYKPWYDKKNNKAYLKPDQGRCLHYYFYFIDADLGLCYVRVPTWCPFRLQIYFNGHSWLAVQLRKKGIQFTLIDNAFTAIDGWDKAQLLADQLNGRAIHKLLNRFARRFCPVIRHFGLEYHWSLMQTEYATDIVFLHQSELQDIYGTLTRTAIHTVKPDNIATFLGRKLNGNYQDEMGNDFHIRIEGTRIKHHMGPVLIKMYDKFHLILRIETTTNDVSFFKHYREVEQRDGTRIVKWAEMKKGIYSLGPLRQVLAAANRRYLEFISAIDDSSAGIRYLNKISRTVFDNDHAYRGFNFFDDEDQALFETIARGEFNIRGFQNKHLRQHLRGKTGTQASRILKRLRLHGLVKKIAGTYRYYLTKVGRLVLAAGFRLKQVLLVPELARETAE
ncbi:MAG: MarR family transcriptional regulator [Acidobacteriia bacterium]|nr:MarR family transcriptional regulator [Terriglobia bacterium]